MLQAEYVRDMYNNYMVLKGMEGKVSAYGTKMLLNNTITGLLKTELRCIDHMDLFYYDITAKKSIAAICDNKSLNYIELRKILSQIIEIIENSGEYLLSENDFIIDPYYVYIDNTTLNLELCHLAGWEDNIQEQLSRFMEYLMNKVDYKDEAAVVLIYAMYKESKEPDCTFERLAKELNIIKNEPKVKKVVVVNEGYHDDEKKVKDQNYNPDSKSITNSRQKEKNAGINYRNDYSHKAKKKTSTKISGNQNIKLLPGNLQSQFVYLINKWLGKNNDFIQKKWNSALLEEVESEREFHYFGRKTYILASLTLVAGIIIFLEALQLKLLHNTFGTHIEATKLLCCIVIIGCSIAYVLIKLFDPKNKRIVIRTEVEYTEPDQDETQLLWMNAGDSEQDKTVILTQIAPQKQYHLLEIKNDMNKKIIVNIFPFVIGKFNKDISLVIEDASVSRRHAVLTREGEDIFLTDLNSTNGTFINGMKLAENKPYRITDKDEISFSQVKYIWEDCYNQHLEEK
ncbi:MAG: DUF6382 domain-containing protein [Anaerocolumna sp.]